MAVFLFGVVIGWGASFALWMIWSFGFLSGLLLGTLIGTATIFVALALQWMFVALSTAPEGMERSVGSGLHPLSKRRFPEPRPGVRPLP